MNVRRAVLITGLWLVCLSALVPPLAAGETIRPEEFAGRCAAGTVTLTQDLKVAQGFASLSGGCTVVVPAFLKFETEDITLEIRDDFVVHGAEKSQIIVAQSHIIQAGVPYSETPAAVRLTVEGREGLVKVQQSFLIVDREVLLQAGGGEKGTVIIQESEVRSYLQNIQVLASRNHSEGKSEVSESVLFAEGHILVAAGDQRNGDRGEAKLQESAAVAWQDVRVLSGHRGKTIVQQDDHDWRIEVLGETYAGIYAMGRFAAASGRDGETIVQENVVHGHDGVSITSGRKTVVQQNNFTDSDPIHVHSDGQCDVSGNMPVVQCG